MKSCERQKSVRACSFGMSSLVLLAVLEIGPWSFPAVAESRWEKLTPLPDQFGFAGAFAGVSGDVLIVTGGANFPAGKPWEGGDKIWHKIVFALEMPGDQWRIIGGLPHPLGYGVSVSCGRGLICIGGSDSNRHYDSVFLLRWVTGGFESESLPSLPEARANMCGALLGDMVYVAGGTKKPDATTAAETLFALDLSRKESSWRKLESVPGPGRIFAIAAAHDGSFYVFGGAALKAGPDGKPVREWLRDAYRYTSGRGWKRTADLPRIAVAAPSPAPVVDGKLLIIGGDDGAQLNTPPTEHKGFPRAVLAYDPKTDKWERLDDAPFSFVTTAAVPWRQRVVIPGGEIRPGMRSPEVWALNLK